MPPPIYISSLVKLLKYLGWEQQGIAERLGVSTTAVSLWATGARPVSRRHEQAFLDLVRTVLHDEQARSDVSEARHRDVDSYIHAWRAEMYVKVGRFQQTIQEQFETLQSPLAKVDPLSLSPLERRQLRFACQRLAHLLDCVDQMSRRTPQIIMTERLNPLEHFDLLRGMYHGRQQAEEE
jgi:predicted transcriptional regulator